MRLRNLLLLGLLLSGPAQHALAQYTEIGGHVTGTLSLADSPFRVIDTVIVPDGDTLSIDPGVEVYVTDVNQQLYIWVYGTLYADGTPDSRIGFKGYQPEQPDDITWNGLFYFQPGSGEDTSLVHISYCDFENAAFAIRTSSREGHVVAHHNIIHNCQHGIFLINSPSSQIYNNTFHQLSANGYGFSLTNNILVPETHVFENNIIADGFIGVYIYWSGYLDVDCDQYLIDYNCFFIDSTAVDYGDTTCVFEPQFNIFEDPQFYDEDHTLRDTSPCIDAGNPYYPWDPDQTTPDMGAVYFSQEYLRANYDEVIPDTIAVSDHSFVDVILADGNPTPFNEMIYTVEGISYDSVTGLLSMHPTLADTGTYLLGFRATNSYNDSTWVDSLIYNLHVVPNTSPRIVTFNPECEEQSGDTSFCYGYFPLDVITFDAHPADDEGDLLNWWWVYDGLTYPAQYSFTQQMRYHGENLVQYFCTDGVDTVGHVWSIYATGYELSGVIAQESLTADEGPYVMVSTAQVAAGDTLTIEPGVRIYVKSASDIALEVQGYLQIEGTREEPVQMFSNNTASFLWSGINLLPGAAGAEIGNLTISSARRAFYLQYSDGPVLLSNCDFKSDSIAVQSHYTDLQVRNCFFNCVLTGAAMHYGIFVEGSHPVSITNCGFGRIFDPVYLYRADVELINNTFAVYSQYYYRQLHSITALESRLRVVNNIFQNFEDVAVFADYNTDDNDGYNGSSWSEIAFNCFHIIPEGATVHDVSQHPQLESDNSLFEDPLLILSPESYDLHLESESPCIDAGAAYLLDPDGSRSDIGMYGGPGASGWSPARAVSPETQPASFQLNSIFPNPFNASTSIDFSLESAGEMRLEVFNIRGQRIARLLDGVQPAGRQIVSFDGNAIASGIYLVRLQQGRQVATGKMLLVK